ncbi:MAG: VOC family protein [Opitutae bacterium]|nr:VOC family protein [Opitutae bacterium]
MQPRFTGIPFFVYPVRDMARARAFYSQVLGLKEVGSWQDVWVEFAVGPVDGPVLAVSTGIDDSQPGAKAGAVALETDDFPGMVAHLHNHGVKFILEPADTGVCHFARFEDPDGNHLVLHAKHAKA